MQEHLELEVSLEIVMAKIAQEIFELEKGTKDSKTNKELEQKLINILEIQDKAYKGNREAVKKILKWE